MKSINFFIREAFGLKSISKNNTPDRIDHDDRTLRWSNKYARAFIYNTKLDDFLLSGMGENHFSIIEDENEDILNEFGLGGIEDLIELRFFSDNFEDIEDSKEWKKQYKYNNKTFKLGRYWIIPKNTWDNDEELIYVAWWNELNSKQFNQFNKRFLDFIGEKNDKEYDHCIFIDNNGTTKYFDKNKKVLVRKASKERKKEIEIARNIHLASQKEKKKFFEKFRKMRDEENQKRYYNHTKSKTEAEYRSIKYQESLDKY